MAAFCSHAPSFPMSFLVLEKIFNYFSKNLSSLCSFFCIYLYEQKNGCDFVGDLTFDVMSFCPFMSYSHWMDGSFSVGLFVWVSRYAPSVQCTFFC